MSDPRRLAELDKAHVWHPFTPMRQWRAADAPEQGFGETLVITHAEGEYLFDAQNRRYIDGTSSLWCNVHGHRVPEIDAAIRAQLDKVSHSTLLGLASEKSVELAAELVRIAPRGLSKVFYSDAGSTALEAAFKMAVGYWFHTGKPAKNRFVAFTGGYHGDTVGSMSVGFSDYFHRPFAPMAFPTFFAPAPDALRSAEAPLAASHLFPSEDPAVTTPLRDRCLRELGQLLAQHSNEIAAVVIEPIMQGAAGMICQPAGFLRGVADLAKKHNVLLIADEVATGFGRTGKLFACEHEGVQPDILCVAKGLTGGYMPLAATLATDEIEQAFTGEIAEGKTFFHGHTYTGNALGCAAALASLKLFESNRLLDRIAGHAKLVSTRLEVLRDATRFPHVVDVRQRGLMIGIELARDRATRTPLDSSKRTGAALCAAMRPKGVITRPLGDTVVLMPIPASSEATLNRLLDVALETLAEWREKI